jgi:peptidoglycan/xylan/chitin deacetylase (PgdA/CDA1 family)
MSTRAAPVPIPILLYHSVSDRAAAGHERFTVAPAVFREHVRALVASGRTPLTLRELGAALRGTRQLPPRPFAVTFDDGFADVRAAIEQLLEAHISASVFITTGSIGRRGMLSSHEVEGLGRLGGRVEVGAHSVTHPRLDELDARSAQREISASKAALEDMLRSQVDSFAYPHGAYDRAVRAAVQESGFFGAAAVKNALSHSHDDRFALARLTVTADTDARQLARLLSGSGAPLAWRRERLRTRGYRAVRRLRRRRGAVL